jgi:nicotinamide riboside kinase
MMFVTGPSKCGKSWLLRHNMDKFNQAKTARPVVFHYDFAQNKDLSFDMFLTDFEHMLID